MTPRTDERSASSTGVIWEIDDEKEAIEGLDENGRPDPAYAAALGLLPAPLGRRALALPCDIAIWAVVQLPLWLGAVPLLIKLATGSISAYGLVNHPGFVLAVIAAAVTVFFTIALSILQLALHGRKGMTIGKAIVGIRTVNVRTLERPGIGWVLLRYLLTGASGIVPLIGPIALLASPAFDPEKRRRGLHDKVTRVWLVDVRHGLNPYDGKRLRVARKLVKAEPAPERAVLPSLATPIDPAEQPEYRPGSRVSAGVLGMARPYEAHERPVVGIPASRPAAPAPVEAGRPVFGGYRPKEDLTAQPDPAPAPVPASVPEQEPAAFGLRFDTGEDVLITEPLLLGRNPVATAEHGPARPMALADDSKSLSKTHLLVRPVDGGLEIIDWGSTNGSGLIRDGVQYTVGPGIPVMIVDGDTVRLGDRTAVVVRMLPRRTNP